MYWYFDTISIMHAASYRWCDICTKSLKHYNDEIKRYQYSTFNLSKKNLSISLIGPLSVEALTQMLSIRAVFGKWIEYVLNKMMSEQVHLIWKFQNVQCKKVIRNPWVYQSSSTRDLWINVPDYLRLRDLEGKVHYNGHDGEWTNIMLCVNYY